MKKLFVTAIAALFLAAVGCEDCEDACAKVKDCVKDEYGSDAASAARDQCMSYCDDDDDACIDCIMDKSCSKILAGDCMGKCE
ncbi:MAG: hypothetical protein R6V85_06700 [Polyangia bacterium]